MFLAVSFSAYGRDRDHGHLCTRTHFIYYPLIYMKVTMVIYLTFTAKTVSLLRFPVKAHLLSCFKNPRFRFLRLLICFVYGEL